jgi:hypothetical protein
MNRLYVVFAGGLVLTCSAPASGQTVDAAALPVRLEHVGPLVVPFVQYGAPQRLTSGLSVLFPIGKTRRKEGALVTRGIEVQGSAGQGGWRVAAGPFRAGLPWLWGDILLTATRTRDDPRGAFPESTYVGVEAGIAIITPLNEFVSHRFGVMFKPSVGFAHRLDGPFDDSLLVELDQNVGTLGYASVPRVMQHASWEFG